MSASHLTADICVIGVLPKKAAVSCREQSHSQPPAYWAASVPSSIETCPEGCWAAVRTGLSVSTVNERKQRLPGGQAWWDLNPGLEHSNDRSHPGGLIRLCPLPRKHTKGLPLLCLFLQKKGLMLPADEHRG